MLRYLITLATVMSLSFGVANAQMAKGIYATHFMGQSTHSDGTTGQHSEAGRLVLDGAGNAAWDLVMIFQTMGRAVVVRTQFNGTYTGDDSSGMMTLMLNGGTTTPITCAGASNPDCTVGSPAPSGHKGWYFCYDEIAYIDCVQAGAFDRWPGWQQPAEQIRWDKVQ